ncbi:tetratricopeptide repeat protein [Paenibacillaceae bacterium WGS1546]|uniref:tetratricopeptide repeat protein n=1 Tax=Cohnella sp. WGS1546 TaxID=3366810 RepID=UPI00372D3268
MIQQWFAMLNEVLDELIIRYPQATNEERTALRQQWDMLKALSDDMIELWLQFEDRMGVFRDMQAKSAATAASEPKRLLASFVKGHGYFQLQMFRQAAAQLQEAVRANPDFLGARMFLAMALMHMKQWNEAFKHFQLIAAMAEDRKLQAIALNALGCIQAVYSHLDQACHYFSKALEADPDFADPKCNLKSLREGKDQVQLQFGSAELQSLVRV